MKWRYFILSVLLLSLIANAIFIPSYFSLRSSSRKVNLAIVTMVHDANLSLQKYNHTHSSTDMGDAAMNLLNASGLLQQYSLTSNDAVANEFSILLGTSAETSC